MERKELIYQLRNAPLDGENPIHWVHLICEAAEMLERDAAWNCEGCLHQSQSPWHEQCAGCARMYPDNYNKNGGNDEQ